MRFCLLSSRFTEEPPLPSPDGDNGECHENSQEHFGETMRRSNPRPVFARNKNDDRQRKLLVQSGVSLDWANECTQRFLQEHLNALQRGIALLRRGGPRSKAFVQRFAPCFQRRTVAEQSCCVLRSKYTKRNFTFCEMSIFKRLRKNKQRKTTT